MEAVGYRQSALRERVPWKEKMDGMDDRPTEVTDRTQSSPSKLKSVSLQGYKSFLDATVTFGDVTVLLGANGAGKSNLVSFFRLLGFLATGALQEFVGRAGQSDSLLLGGRRTTPQLQAEVEFRGRDHTKNERTTTTYRVRLADAAPDTLIFLPERALFHRSGHPGGPRDILLGGGHRESRLWDKAREGDKTCHILSRLLSGCRSFQFHDTSPQANIRKSRYTDDAAYLRDDGGNLAPYLYAMQRFRPDCYRRIVDTIRLVFPAFGDFSLVPNENNPRYILLNWREKGRSDYLFGPHQLSDGTLRFMALATLLLQPRDKLPGVIVLDEPELGLHPYAISIFAAMVRSAATEVQVVLATQSTRLVDEFDQNQIVVLENEPESGTKCHRLKSGDLEEWLADHSLGELWEKNHFGGRP